MGPWPKIGMFEPVRPSSADEDITLRKPALASRLNVTTRTVTDWQGLGLPTIRVTKRLNLYHWPSVKTWLMRRQTSVIAGGTK